MICDVHVCVHIPSVFRADGGIECLGIIIVVVLVNSLGLGLGLGFVVGTFTICVVEAVIVVVFVAFVVVYNVGIVVSDRGGWVSAISDGLDSLRAVGRSDSGYHGLNGLGGILESRDHERGSGMNGRWGYGG